MKYLLLGIIIGIYNTLFVHYTEPTNGETCFYSMAIMATTMGFCLTEKK